jgi:hypothetical protein
MLTRVPRRLLMGVITALFALPGAGCSLLLDFGDGGGNAIDGGVPDAEPTGDGGDACAAFEPNNSLAMAHVLTEAGTLDPVGICPTGDRDFFRFTVDGIQDTVIEALFTNAPQMDLEMRLYDGTGMVIDRSETFDSNERIERSAANANTLAAGTYFAEVFGFGNTDTNTYSFVLELTTP